MIRTRTRFGLSIVTFLGFALVSPAGLATNGYFSHGVSIKEKGLVGAGVAHPQDTLSAASNPASMVWQGNRWDVGASWFSPMRDYTVEGAFPAPPPSPFRALPGPTGLGDTVDSGRENFIIPTFGYNRMLSPDSSIGISVYGRGGMNTSWKQQDTFMNAGVFGAGDTGVDLAQLFIQPTYARKISNTSSWGVSPILAIQTFEAKGISSFAPFSNDPANLSNNGTDTSVGYGLEVGWQGQVVPNLTLGASYQSEIKMDEFDDYAGLFAERGDFDIPSSWNIGLAWKVTPKSTLVVDVQRVNYTDVPAVSNPSLSTLFASCAALGGGGTSGCLGGNNGAGFGWDDVTVFKIGYEWQTGSNWIWRVGASKGDQPINEDQDNLFNILAPGIMEEHFTFGFTRKLANNGELNFAVMYAPEECIKGLSDPISDPPFPGPEQTTELCMDQFEFSLSYSKAF